MSYHIHVVDIGIVRSPAAAVACGCSDCDRRPVAGDGLSPPTAAAAGMPTPASRPGTPLPERTKLVLVSMSGDESILCPLTWVTNSIRPA